MPGESYRYRVIRRKTARESPKGPSRQLGAPKRPVGLVLGVLDRAKSLSEARGKSLLVEASSLLEGMKKANLDDVLKIAPGRTRENQVVWSLAMASTLATQAADLNCDCTQKLDTLQQVRATISQRLGELEQAEALAEGEEAAMSAAASDEEEARKAYQLAVDVAAGLCAGFGLLDPACYAAMIYEAIKGNEWSSAYDAMKAAAGVAYEGANEVAVLKEELAMEQKQESYLENVLMACLINCTMGRIKPSDAGSWLMSKKRAKAQAARSVRKAEP